MMRLKMIPFDEQMVVIGHRLQMLRKQAKMTQTELAITCIMAPTTISNIELGYGNPGLSTIMTLCAALNIQPSDILNDIDEPHINDLAATETNLHRK